MVSDNVRILFKAAWARGTMRDLEEESAMTKKIYSKMERVFVFEDWEEWIFEQEREWRKNRAERVKKTQRQENEYKVWGLRENERGILCDVFEISRVIMRKTSIKWEGMDDEKA